MTASEKEYLAIAQEAFDRGEFEYSIGHRGGYLTMGSMEVCGLLHIPSDYLNNLPRKVGAGCNYLGGGIRGSVMCTTGFEEHGVPAKHAKKLEAFANACKQLYINIEDGMNNEEDDDGETNWDAKATNAARRAGIVSAY